MEYSIPLRPSWWPLRLAVPLAMVGVGVLWWREFPGVALLLLVTTAVEVMVHVRRQAALPQALFLQGMRWWLVSATGELEGPWRLSGRSRRGSLWVELRLRDHRQRRTLWVQRDMVSAEGWSMLHWQLLWQASRQSRGGSVGPHGMEALVTRVKASIRSHRPHRSPRDNPG